MLKHILSRPDLLKGTHVVIDLNRPEKRDLQCHTSPQAQNRRRFVAEDRLVDKLEEKSEKSHMDTEEGEEDELFKKTRQFLLDLQAQEPLDFDSAWILAHLKETLESLPALAVEVRSGDENLELNATRLFRKLLSIGDKQFGCEGRSPLVEKIIEAGVVPCFVQFLKRGDNTELQFEAAWALAILSAGPAKLVIDHGAVPIFVKLLSSPSVQVQKAALSALANIADGSPAYRDLVLGEGSLASLTSQWADMLSESAPRLRKLHECVNLSLQRTAAWALALFCKGKPQPPFEQVRPALPILKQLLHSSDEKVKANTCWALSYLSDGTKDKIQAVIDSGVCQYLVDSLFYPSSRVFGPALRAVGNIVTSTGPETQCIIFQALPRIRSLLKSNYEKSIKKEACRVISNITAGSEDQIQAVINANIVGPLVNLLRDAEFEVKKEAACAISNATSGGSHEQIKYLVSQGCVGPLCDLLVCGDTTTVTVCLEGLENVMKVGEAEESGSPGDLNPFARMIHDVSKKLENLGIHRNNSSQNS